MIIENASGSLPATRLNVSSTAGGPLAELFRAEPPRERRRPAAEGAAGRGGGGKEEWRRLFWAARPSLEGPPYMVLLLCVGGVILDLPGRRWNLQHYHEGQPKP